MNITVIWKRVSLAMILIGLVGAGAILIFGEEVMGASNAVPWGFMNAAYLFFIAISVGLVLIASLWYVFNLADFEMVRQRALYLAMISVFMGFTFTGLELGRPFNMVWLLFSPNFTSPIWWMSALYGLYLGSMVLTIYNIYKTDYGKERIFGRLTALAGLFTVANLGSVFGNAQTRVYWQGAAIPLHVVITALITGTAILVIAQTQLGKSQSGVQKEKSTLPLLGRLLLGLVGLLAFAKFWYLSNSLYSHNPGTYEAARLLVSGPLSIQFWVLEVGLAMVVPLLLLAKPSNYTTGKLFWAAAASLIGLFFIYNNFVLAGQLVPLNVVPGQPLAYHYYQAMPAEWAVAIGTIGAFIYLSLWVENRYFSNAATGTVSVPQMKGS